MEFFLTNLYTVSSSARLLDDLIASIALTIDVCRVSMDIPLWLNQFILSDNKQNRVIIAAINWDDFQRAIEIRVVNLSV